MDEKPTKVNWISMKDQTGKETVGPFGGGHIEEEK